MFALTSHKASFSNLNVRIERHGDDRKLATDLKFTANAGNAILDDIDKGLRDALFRKPGSGEQQPLPIDGNNLTAVKFPALAPVKLAHEFPGYELDISSEAGEENDDTLPLVDVTVKRLEIAPIEGGSVSLTFTASVNAEPGDLTDLATLLEIETVYLTLTPPKAQAQLDDEKASGDMLDQQDAEEAQKELDRLAKIGKAA